MYSKIQLTGIYWLFTGFWRRNGGQSAAVVCTRPTSLDFVIKSGEGWTSSFSRFGQGDLSEKWQAESWMMRTLYGLRKKKKNKDPPKELQQSLKKKSNIKFSTESRKVAALSESLTHSFSVSRKEIEAQRGKQTYLWSHS